MNVASLESCRELYALSGWFDTFANYYLLDGYRSLRPAIKVGDEYPGHQLVLEAPAYDLGYLMRKLPACIENESLAMGITGGFWWANYRDRYMPYDPKYVVKHQEGALTPEDALCKLAVQLFKQGILRKEEG